MIIPPYYRLLSTIFLIGCSLFPEPEGLPDRFLLDALATSVSPSSHLKPAIIVDQPSVYAPLDNTRIAIKPTAHTIDYIADIEWGDRLSTLIYESMIQSFQNAKEFEAVGRLNSGQQAKYMLSTDVRKFYKRCCDHNAEVEYFIQVFDMNDRKTIGSQVFNISLPIKEESANNIAQSLNDAHKKILEKILLWLKNLSS